jgi:hypothetical protein
MAEKDEAPKAPPREENTTRPERPKFPENRPIEGDNKGQPNLIAGRD